MVQILEANPNVGWGSIGAAFGGGLGQGLQEARQMTMADKMQVLKQQRELQAQEQKLSMIDKQFPGMGNAVRAVGPQGAAMIIKEYGPEGISRIFGPQAQFQAPRTTALSGLQQEIPYEDREAIEEAQEFPSAQRLEGYPGEMAVKKRPLPEREITSLDEYRRKIAPNYDQLGKTAKESVDRRAEREFNAAMSERKERFRETEPERKRLRDETEIVDAMRQSSRIEDQAASVMENAINSGELGALSLNNLAMNFNLPGLLSPDAAAFNAAVKELFVGSLSAVPGSKLNMWIDQQVKSMIPQISNSKPAALSMLEVVKSKNALNKENIRLHDELEEKYPDNPKAMLREKNKRLDEFSENLQKQTAYNIQKIKEDAQREEDPYTFNSVKKVSPGTPLTLEKAEVLLKIAGGDKAKARKIAKHYGYDIETLGSVGEK